MYTMFTIMMVMKPQHCLQRKKNTILRDRLCKSTSAVVTIATSKTTKNILSGLKFILALDVVSYKWKIMYQLNQNTKTNRNANTETSTVSSTKGTANHHQEKQTMSLPHQATVPEAILKAATNKKESRRSQENLMINMLYLTGILSNNHNCWKSTIKIIKKWKKSKNTSNKDNVSKHDSVSQPRKPRKYVHFTE